MVSKDHDLSVRRQCSLLLLTRSNLYYQPKGESAENLRFMVIIDKQFLETPWYGSRQMARYMQRQGHKCGRHRVRRLMRLMRLVPIYQTPNTSKKHPQHKIYPYLLRKLAIDRPNQVWCVDITYIPMRHGFMYLVAVIDWFSRHVLSWRLSNSLDTSFCLEALEDALTYATPEIFNTDQGTQFTSLAFTSVLDSNGVAISISFSSSEYNPMFPMPTSSVRVNSSRRPSDDQEPGVSSSGLTKTGDTSSLSSSGLLWMSKGPRGQD